MADRVEWITDRAGLERLADGWELLAAGEPSPFARHAWFSAWWRAFGGARELRICALWRGERLCAVFPLFADRRRLGAMANVHTPLFRPLAVDRAAMRALCAAVLSARPERLDIPALPMGDPALDELLTLGRRERRTHLIEPHLVSPIVDTTGELAEWRALTKDRWQAPIERLRRKLQREHETELTLVEAPADLEGDLERGFAVEGSGWKGRAGTAISSSPRTLAFYQAVGDAYHRLGALRLSGISMDGRVIAFDLSLLHRGRLFLLKTGFDESYRRLAPGLVLRLSVIERCFELGLEAHELLGDDNGWKRKFATSERRHCLLRSYRARPVPLAHYGYRRFARPALKRVADRVLPPGSALGGRLADARSRARLE